MKLAIFGKTGQVARELQAQVPDAIFLDRAAADLTDADACAALIRRIEADAVINAAAYTAVDAAEDDPLGAHAVNAASPGAMAVACAARKLPFVTISTDYVFDGSGSSPFAPEDTTGPLGVYGASKLAGEEMVRSAGGAAAILRTSWVFSAHGKNFVKTMLRLAETRDSLTVVGDQIGGPTPAADIARACVTIAQALAEDPGKAGTFHFAGAPDASWATFARAIFDLTGAAVAVEDIPTTAYPTPAARPLNSRLDCSTTEATFGLGRPDWRAGLRAVLSDLGAIS